TRSGRHIFVPNDLAVIARDRPRADRPSAWSMVTGARPGPSWTPVGPSDALPRRAHRRSRILTAPKPRRVPDVKSRRVPRRSGAAPPRFDIREIGVVAVTNARPRTLHRVKVRLAYGTTGLEVELPDDRTTVVEPAYHAGAP